MKKILFVIITSFILFFPLNVKAEALPEITQYTFEVIEGGMQDLVSTGIQYKGLSPYTDGIFATYQIVGELYKQYNNSTDDSIALWTCGSDDVSVYPLSDSDVNYLNNLRLFDRTGNLVTSSDCYYLVYDNGYFHGSCYVDSSGNIVYEGTQGISASRILGNIAFGGNLVEWEDWNNFYDLIQSGASANQGNFTFSDVDISDCSVLIWVGYGGIMNGNQQKQELYIFIPNAYDFNNCVVSQSGSSISRDTFRFNNTDSFIYKWKVISGANYNELGSYSASSSNTSFGVRYSGSFSYNSGVISSTVNSTYAQFLSYVSPSNNYAGKYFTLAYHNNLSYNQGLAIKNSQAKIDSFMPLQFPNGSFIHPEPIPQEYIDLSELEEFSDGSEAADPEQNPNFDPSEIIDPNNYPEIKTLPSEFPSISDLPENQPEDDPQQNPVYPPVPPIQPDSEYDPEVNPETDPLPDPIPEAMLDDTNPPLINGLQNRFPFCIPWDLKELLNNLSHDPEPPAWNFDYSITAFNHTYTMHVQGDLSDFNDLASLFRKFQLILFMVGLMYFSYKLFI